LPGPWVKKPTNHEEATTEQQSGTPSQPSGNPSEASETPSQASGQPPKQRKRSYPKNRRPRAVKKILPVSPQEGLRLTEDERIQAEEDIDKVEAANAMKKKRLQQRQASIE